MAGGFPLQGVFADGLRGERALFEVARFRRDLTVGRRRTGGPHIGILQLRDLPHGAMPAVVTGAVVFALGMGWNIVNGRFVHLPPLTALIAAIARLGIARLALVWRFEPILASFGPRVITGS